MSDAAKLLPQPLRQVLETIPRMAVAFSGGVDSRFLAAAAHLMGCAVRLYHAAGPHLAPHETEYAVTWAEENHFPLEISSFNPLSLPELNDNPPHRCYICKKGLIGIVQQQIQNQDDNYTLCDGTHTDDNGVFRPGQRAVKEAGVVSPLALSGMGKAAIRQVARLIGLAAPEQKARPCMLTRFAYGLHPTEALLQQVASCEAKLAEQLGLTADFRLRLTPRPILQISAHPGDLWPKAQQILTECGFSGSQLLVTDKISGFFDRL